MAANSRPPGPRLIPLIGSNLAYLRDPLGFIASCKQRYGDVVRTRLLGMENYFFFNPNDIEIILRGNHANFRKDYYTRLLKRVLGEGLLTSDGDLWRRQRSLAQPAFQMARVQQYGSVVVAHTQRMLHSWRDGQELHLHEAMMHLTLEIVAKTLFGMDALEQAWQVGDALNVVMEYFLNPLYWSSVLRLLPLPANIRFRRATRTLNKVLQDIIVQGRARGPGREDLLCHLLFSLDEAGGRMTDVQLRDELLTLLLAGHETTALALTYTFYLLGRHPQALAALEAELDRLLAGRSPTAADLPNLRYTEWVIRESMRLYPPAWAIGREARDDCTIAGYHIPRGTQLQLVQWIVHRDPRWFDEPETFRPERWDKDLARRLPRCAYFPFGDGPRICIGKEFAMMEAVLVLATMAHRYRVNLVPDQPFKLLPSVTLRPKYELKIQLQERAKAGECQMQETTLAQE